MNRRIVEELEQRLRSEYPPHAKLPSRIQQAMKVLRDKEDRCKKGAHDQVPTDHPEPARKNKPVRK
jgi:hypothetical protein